MPIVFHSWITPGGIVATPGYSVFLLPWAGYLANTGGMSRNQSSARLGGASASMGGGAQNDEANTDIQLETLTYKIVAEHYKGVNQGIATIKLAGSTMGTIDFYNGSETENNLSEVTSLAVTGGPQNFQMIGATKNASAGGYGLNVNSATWIATS